MSARMRGGVGPRGGAATQAALLRAHRHPPHLAVRATLPLKAESDLRAAELLVGLVAGGGRPGSAQQPAGVKQEAAEPTAHAGGATSLDAAVLRAVAAAAGGGAAAAHAAGMGGSVAISMEGSVALMTQVSRWGGRRRRHRP